MLFNSHFDLAGRHAELSASNPHWVNYSEEKFDRVYLARQAAKRGSELHDLAHHLIRLGVKLPKTRQTLNMYVNDAIGFGMSPEQILFFSEYAFGTADAVGYNPKKKFLRIRDLKTGVIEASVLQLEVYAAFFCLEYRMKPFEMDIELRIYQNDEVKIYDADPDDIFRIMDKAITLDKRMREMKREALA